MKSIWYGDLKGPRFDSLQQDMQTDVLIIGGGITGILCAYFLKKAGVDCVIAEADRVAGGITQNTTAKITCQHGLLYDKMIQRFGTETAGLYFRAQQEALKQYQKLCAEISCDFKECSSVVYSCNDRDKIEREVLALNQIGCPAEFIEQIPLPVEICGAVKVEHQAQFHPLKFIFEMAKDLTIFENTKILEIGPRGAKTEKGTIQAKTIIVATHFPFLNKHGGYFLKLYQHRSYVLALKGGADVTDMYVDENKKGLSFRGYQDLLLLGGGSHRTGKQGGGWNELSHFAKIHYPHAKEVCRWATQDCMTLDDIPYIGQYSKRTPSLYVATGYNKWGMTSAMSAAMLLTDLVQGKDNDYTFVFSPSRSILRPQLSINMGESLVGLLTPTTPRCPHMGCALHYNPQEHSWDCSCHGSRFTQTGEVINNPATDDKPLKNN